MYKKIVKIVIGVILIIISVPMLNLYFGINLNGITAGLEFLMYFPLFILGIICIGIGLYLVIINIIRILF